MVRPLINEERRTFLNRELRKVRRSSFLFDWAFLLLTVLVVFAPTTRQYFYSDDFTMLGWFQRQTDWVSAATEEFRRGYGLRFLLDLILWARFRLFGWNPLPYYLISLIQHWLASVLVYVFALKLSKDERAALLSGLIFAVSLSHQEGITWIVGSDISLLTIFYLACILCYIEFIRTRWSGWYIFSYLAFIAALATGEYTVTLPFSLALIEFVYRPDGKVDYRRAASRLALFFLILVPYLGIEFWFLSRGTSEGVSAGMGSFRPGFHTFGAFPTLGFLAAPNPYLLNFFPRLIDWLQTGPPVFSAGIQVYEWVVKLAWMAASTFLFIKGNRTIRFLVLWICLTFAPFSLWSVPSLWNASRYLYLPSLGFSILAAVLFLHAWDWAGERFLKPKRSVLAALALLWVLVNLLPLYALQFQMIRSGQIRRDIVEQIQTNQPSFPEGASVYIKIPHGIYRDVAIGIPQFYTSQLAVHTIPPESLPTRPGLLDYFFEYKDGQLHRVFP